MELMCKFLWRDHSNIIRVIKTIRVKVIKLIIHYASNTKFIHSNRIDFQHL